MPTLYELCVPTFVQTVRAVAGVLARTTQHCAVTAYAILRSRGVPLGKRDDEGALRVR